MERKKYKSYTAEFKTEVALETIRADLTLHEISSSSSNAIKSLEIASAQYD